MYSSSLYSYVYVNRLYIWTRLRRQCAPLCPPPYIYVGLCLAIIDTHTYIYIYAPPPYTVMHMYIHSIEIYMKREYIYIDAPPPPIRAPPVQFQPHWVNPNLGLRVTPNPNPRLTRCPASPISPRTCVRSYLT